MDAVIAVIPSRLWLYALYVVSYRVSKSGRETAAGSNNVGWRLCKHFRFLCFAAGRRYLLRCWLRGSAALLRWGSVRCELGSVEDAEDVHRECTARGAPRGLHVY